MLGLTFIVRAATDLTHPVETRILLYYAFLIAPWVSGLTILIFYSLFNLQKGVWFWLVISSIILAKVPLPASFHWLTVAFHYYLLVELIRIVVVATRRKLLGARMVAIGVLVNAGLWVADLLLQVFSVPVIGNEWVYHLLYNVAFLFIPLILSLRLALEHGWTSRLLEGKLHEVEDLSARNLAQQRDKEQLLARQNEELERQVEKRTQELRQQADQLKELDEAKSRFVTNLTHEFRTPLSLIISPVGKLLDSPTLPISVQASLQTVDRNARHLLSQVNQLLDIARLEAGHTGLTLQPVLLGQFTSQIADLFHSLADARQIAFTFHADIPDGLYLMDTDKWNKIVYNLLNNAFKFTPTGGCIQSGCQLENGQVCFSVTDTGIGIAVNKLPFIFDRFYQADDALSRSYEGTGIGLALVRELTTLLGGSVEVHSKPGVGSTFTVQLPVQVAPGNSPFTTDIHTLYKNTGVPSVKSLAVRLMPEGAVVNTNSPLILIVEDNADLCQFIADELAVYYQVLTADNGREGWELTRQHLPDIVLSDVMMPLMNGLELTQQIRENPLTDHIAILLVTARSAHENRLDSLRLGADEYVVKPFDLAELHLRLANIISRRQKLQAFYRQQLTQSSARKEFVPLASEDPFLTRIYSLLELNLSNSQVGVTWLAEQVAMDRKTLYRKLQAKLQLTPHELIRTYRLRRSSDLLRQGKSVVETAYSVGFDNVNYFGQCFKEQYQLTPGEFINQKR